jgi:hypothetical protein
MCDVITPIVGAATAIAGTALDLYGQKASDRAAAATAEYQATMAEQDRAAALSRAQSELAAGEEEASRQRRQAAKEQGRQASLLAANGLVIDSGTPLSILADAAEEAGHENTRIRHRAAMNAWQLQQQGLDAQNRAILLRATKNDPTARARAGKSLLGGLKATVSYGDSLFKERI